MQSSDAPPRRLSAGALARPGAAFAATAAATALAVWLLGAALAGPAAALLPVAGYLLLAAVAGRGLQRHWTADRLGPANVVTLARAGLVCLMLLPLAAPQLMAGPAAWSLVALATVTLALDGVDGWLARHSGLATAYGARLDMEVDALFALLLALVALRIDAAGPWVLLLGGLRYLFVAAGWLLPWLNGPLPPSLRRKAVCVVQIATLVALLAPALRPPLSGALALAALALLVWSFAVDVARLARSR